jgi:ABC-type transport system involved in multi-copper enzyme maturation permease subunit
MSGHSCSPRFGYGQICQESIEMSTYWGFGPVFEAEWLATSRRWQLYAGRTLFVGILALGLAAVWGSQVAGHDSLTIHEMAGVGRAFYRAIVFGQLTLVMLAAPAATAGVLCQGKARGSLALELITDLSDTEIVLGKLAARLAPVIGTVCCALPVLALSTLLGGVDPWAMAGTFCITLSMAVLSCTIAFTFSVWGTKTYEVLLATFAALTIWLLLAPVLDLFTHLWSFPPLPRWAISSHPYILAFAPNDHPGEVGLVDFLIFCLVALGISIGLILLSIGRLRAVVVGQADYQAARRKRRPEFVMALGPLSIRAAPSLDDNAPLWYESHRTRLSPWIRVLIGLYVGFAMFFTVLAVIDSVAPARAIRGWLSGYVVAFQVTMGLPFLVVSATTALVEERARGSLDVLLTTPLSSRSIVLAKWWSVFQQIAPLLILPTLVASVLAWETEQWVIVALMVLFLLAAGAAWTSIGLAISTWIPRLGRAVSVAVVIYTLVGLGWPMLALTLFGGYHGAGFTFVSPFHGSFYLTYGIQQPDFVFGLMEWAAAWTAAYLVIAATLLLATLGTFDRCLGRIPERKRRPAARETSPSPVLDPVAG